MVSELLTSAAAERNKDPILTVLESSLPASGEVLEIASGTGQHITFFAARMPHLQWQPSEPDPSYRASIAAHIAAAQLTNVAAPVALDVHQTPWPLPEHYGAVICINMIHIAPWSATEALLCGAARHLRDAGQLILYGPYLENGTAAPSNLEFNASLKQRNAAWGLRDLDEVTRAAAQQGLVRRNVVRMPANNLTVVFSKTP